jgi:hypothetical protein
LLVHAERVEPQVDFGKKAERAAAQVLQLLHTTLISPNHPKKERKASPTDRPARGAAQKVRQSKK